jgi:hypothetical protein
MITCASALRNLARQNPARVGATAALLAVTAVLSGCSSMSDDMSAAFADPSRYELYDCKQLENERKGLASRAAELQGLMAKAETGTAGPLVAEMAYRNDYIAVRGMSHFADEAWRKNKCHESTPAATAPITPPTPAPPAKPSRKSKASSAIN